MTIIIRKLGRPGCRPCAVLSNYLEEIETELRTAGSVVSEHDVILEHGLLEKYEITGVPVMIFERNGLEVARLTGLVSTQEILETLEIAKEVR